jgi:hypothetical protein
VITEDAANVIALTGRTMHSSGSEATNLIARKAANGPPPSRLVLGQDQPRRFGSHTRSAAMFKRKVGMDRLQELVRLHRMGMATALPATGWSLVSPLRGNAFL